MYQYVLHWSPEEEQPMHLHIDPKIAKQPNSIPCPVCRKPLSYDMDCLSKSTKPIETPVRQPQSIFIPALQELKRVSSTCLCH